MTFNKVNIQIFGISNTESFEKSRSIAICLSDLFPSTIHSDIHAFDSEDLFLKAISDFISRVSDDGVPLIYIIVTTPVGGKIHMTSYIEFVQFVCEKYGISPSCISKSATPNLLRIFVAGDSSKVGKSTICIGLLGALMKEGYAANEIAYVKPATQCEAVQLVTRYCKYHGIRTQPVSPIVFYNGFTREFLDGNTISSTDLLNEVVKTCDELSKGMKVLIIDGVGYPSVGSICGISNAEIAKACNAPVLLVAKRGVGDAVDSFNLNASYFKSFKVPVLGAIFNKVQKEGFYSLDMCQKYVDSYFVKYLPFQMPYGYIPELNNPLLLASNKQTCDTNTILNEEEESFTQIVVNVFYQNIDVKRLLSDCLASEQLETKKRTRDEIVHHVEMDTEMKKIKSKHDIVTESLSEVN